MVKKEEVLFHGTKTHSGPGPPHSLGFIITLRYATFHMTPLYERSARHTTHNRPTPMSPPGFETTIPASERPQTHALDRAATGIGKKDK